MARPMSRFAIAVLASLALSYCVVANAADTTAPTTPNGAAASAVSSSQINLSWNASTDSGGSGLAGYKVERCQGSSCSNYSQIATTTSTSYSNTGLTASTTYRYRVRAYDNAANNSSYSSTVNATTQAADTTAPTTPTGAAASAVSTSQINLSWNASADSGGSGLAGYKIERCQGSSCSSYSQITTTTSTSYSDTGLTASTIYRYRVRAYDNATNNGSYSSTVNATTQAAPDTQPPTVPGGFTVTAASSSQLNLSWSASTDSGGSGLAGYKIERCQDGPDDECADFAQIATTTSRTYNNTGLTFDTAYRYRVRAYDNAGNHGGYSAIVGDATLPDTTAPTTPGGFTATAASVDQINLAWSASTDSGGSGLAGYKIERCPGSFCSNYAQIAVTASTSYADSGLSPSSPYRYRVRAYDNSGNNSGYSTVKTATTLADQAPPSVPVDLSGVALSTSQISLTWSPSTDNVAVYGYNIARCTGSGCTGFVYRGSVNGVNTFTDSGLNASTVYRYQVSAFDATGNASSYSSPTEVATEDPDYQPPSVPTGLSAAPVSSTEIGLSWTAATDNKGISAYQIDRCIGSSCEWVGNSSTTSFIDSGLSPATLYRHSVRAIDTNGNAGDWSALSSATTLPAGDGKTYQYNSAGRLIGVTDSAGATVTYTYDAAGNVIGIQGSL